MKATIVDKKEIAKGTLQVELKPREPMDFLPGQYVDLILINPPYEDDRGNKRHFSIVNSPNHNGTLIFATRLRDSGFKKALKEMPIGAKIEIHHIGGSFILPKGTDKNYVFTSGGRKHCFIAGGIGITPFMSMLRYIQDNNLSYKITLIYSNRDQESTAFLEQLRELEEKLPKFSLILTMTEDPNWQGEKRRIDANFIREYLKEPSSYTYYIAGPPAMVEAITNELKLASVASQNIIAENFTGYE